jgi:predicted nucleic acid-binding protein
VKLLDDVGRGAVAIDTAVFIYFIEEHPRYPPLIAPLFEEAARGKRELVTSAVTLLDLLVVPYRVGNLQLAQRYEVLLTRSGGVRVIDITRDQLRAAAQLRAATAMKTPDALQVAAAFGSSPPIWNMSDAQRARARLVTTSQLNRTKRCSSLSSSRS